MKQTLTLLSFALILSASARANWNQFRGPDGDGNAGAVDLPTEFSDTKNVRWRTAIHDQGHSSPVIWENQIWMTSGHADNSKLFAICVDLQSGKILHDIVVFDIPPPNLAYPNLNSPASPTAFVEEGRVYVHFGTFGTACLDTQTGEKLWERTDLHCDHRVRAASSPIIDGDLLYLTFDGVDVQFFIALNKHTGKTVWRRDRSVNKDLAKVLSDQGFDPEETLKEKPGDNRKSYATPTIIEHAGRRQVVSPAAEATYGYDAKTGEELWHVIHPGMGWNVTCRPIYCDGLVYFNTGISNRLFAVDPSGTGNITDSHVRWIGTKNVSNLPSFVIENDLIFMISDQSGLASCLDAKTGKQVWRERLRAGREHWASPIAANGKVYFSSKAGDIAIIAADREFKLLAKNSIDGTINASPAVAGNSLILRSATHLYHIAEGYETAPQEKKPGELQEKEIAKTKGIDLKALASDLRKAVKSGEITEAEAKAKWAEFSGENWGAKSGGDASSTAVLLEVVGYYMGGETNDEGKFEARFLIEWEGEEKDNWPTVTFTGEQFRELCKDLGKYHRVVLNLANGKAVKPTKGKGKGAKKKQGKEAKQKDDTTNF